MDVETRTTSAAAVVAALLLVAAAGCTAGTGSIPSGRVELSDLRTAYGCGYGFQAGDAVGTVGIFLEHASPGEPPPVAPVDLGDGDAAWSGEIRLGRGLFNNWCNDILAEPEATVDQTWELVDGVVAITEVDESAGTATLRATDLVAVDPSGTRHALGDITLVNDAWGVFAG